MDVNEEVVETTTDEATEGQTLSDADLMGQAETTVETPVETPTETEELQAYEIGGERYELPALEELISAGKDAKEIKAESTRKFQEAAEMRKETEWAAELQRAWNAGPEGRQAIIANLQKLDQDAGGVVVPQTAEVKFEDMTETEQYLYRQVMEVRQENSRLRNEITPTLQDVAGFVGQTKAERENESFAKQITAQYRVEMTPEQVAEMRANGIQDPVKAFGFMQPKFQALVTDTHAKAVKEKPNTPTGDRSKVFDDSEMSGDEILFNLNKGLVPASRTA